MGHPFGRALLVCNPRSGRGTVGRTLPELRRHLDARGVDHDVHLTAGPGDATRAARAAAEGGTRYVIAVGGDGTVHEVVNGLLRGDGTPVADDLVLGVASAGSGGDFARTFGLDRKPEVIARHLATDATMAIDVGRATFTDRAGATRSVLFANIAEVGYGAEVVRRAERLPRFVGRVRYLLASWAAIREVRRPRTRVVLAHADVTVPLVNLVVANGQFFGGAMKVAPRALPDDGRFNVQAFTGSSSQVFTMGPKIYKGDHLPHPQIAEWQSATVDVEAPEGQRLAVEADGEWLGYTPARFAVVDTPLLLSI